MGRGRPSVGDLVVVYGAGALALRLLGALTLRLGLGALALRLGLGALALRLGLGVALGPWRPRVPFGLGALALYLGLGRLAALALRLGLSFGRDL